MSGLTKQRALITDRERAAFLRELTKGGKVLPAARKAGRNPQTFYNLRNSDSTFAGAWLIALNGRGGRYTYATEAERSAARRESWRLYKQRVRAEAAKFPSEDNYRLWLATRDSMLRWWLERYTLDEIRAMGATIDFALSDHSSSAKLRRRAGSTQVAA